MTDLFDDVAILLDVNYLDMGGMGVSMEDLLSGEDKMVLRTRDELALLGPADDVWASQDM